MKAKVYETIKNVNFIRDENNRPIFQNVNGTPSATLKKAWEDKHFSTTSEEGTFNGKNTIDATLTIPYTDFGKVRAINYIKLEVSGEVLYYFVEKVVTNNETKATLSLYLDVITTYFDKLNFKGSSKIERKHFDRWKIVGTEIVANFDEENGIWNGDSEVDNQTFIKNSVVNIDLFTPLAEYAGENTAQLNYGGFYPYAIMNREYGNTPIKDVSSSSTFLNSTTGLQSAIVPLGMRTNIGSYEIKNLLENINSAHSSFIEKIYALPMPLYRPKKEKLEYYYEVGTFETSVFRTIKDDIYFANKANIYGAQKQPTSILIPQIWGWNYSLKNIGYKLISDLKSDYDYRNESKLLSSRHMKIELHSSNNQVFQIINEFVMSEKNIPLYITQAIFTDGGYQFVSVQTPKYKNYVDDGSKVMVISYKDQIPNASTPYNDFLKTNGNQYKTAIANNRINTAVGVGLGLVGSLATKNPLGALGSVMGLTSGINKERQMKSQVSDLKNMGTTTEIQDTNIVKDMKIGETFGDTQLNLSIENHPIIQQKSIANFYNKYGYETDTLQNFLSYSDFLNRSLFSYWKSPKISKSIQKDIVGKEILSVIDKLFDDGITFWSIDDNGEGNFNDYTKENWEKDIAKQITN